MMKKLCLSAFAFLALSATGEAQNFRYRAEAGANFSNITISMEKHTIPSSLRPGYRVGGAVEIQLTPSLYIAPGVNFKMNGAKLNPSKELADFANNLAGSLDGAMDIIRDLTGGAPGLIDAISPFKGLKGFENSAITMHYVQIPVSLGYRFEVSPLMAVSVEGGLYGAIALSMKSRVGQEKANLFEKGATFFGQKLEKSPSRLDYGLNLSAAFHYTQYYFRLGTGIGLRNLSEHKDGKMTNNEFYTTVGISF